MALDMILSSLLENGSPEQYIKLINDFVPMAIQCLPDKYKNKQISELLIEFLTYSNSNFNDFIKYIIFDNPESNIFSCFKNLCEFLSDENNKKEIKQLIVCLSLSSETIIQKNIQIQMAGIDLTKTIKNCLENNISNDKIDRIFFCIKNVIENILVKELKNLEFNKLYGLFKTDDDSHN